MDKLIDSRKAASPGAQDIARCRGARAAAHKERGQALLEFAYLLPILLILLLGMIAFGITLNNYLEMTNGATTGAQLLSISRGQTSDPCMTAGNAFNAATPNLTKSSLAFTFTITPPAGSPAPSFGPSTMGSPATCSAAAASMVQGAQATMSVTYPCNLKVLGVDFAPHSGCTLTAQTAEAVQ